ncbi:hypothetical protein [Streptomyces sp. NPDC004134]|uniref:hypothetical protein n=1 Tax=Streptomyces sp. NPDC004134 TaxID=3364691 RepID=UPI0036AABF76
MRPGAAPLTALVALLAFVLLVPAAPAPAVPAAPAGPAGTGSSPVAGRWPVTAPGGRVGATLERHDDGALRLSVSLGDVTGPADGTAHRVRAVAVRGAGETASAGTEVSTG